MPFRICGGILLYGNIIFIYYIMSLSHRVRNSKYNPYRWAFGKNEDDSKHEDDSKNESHSKNDYVRDYVQFPEIEYKGTKTYININGEMVEYEREVLQVPSFHNDGAGRYKYTPKKGTGPVYTLSYGGGGAQKNQKETSQQPPKKDHTPPHSSLIDRMSYKIILYDIPHPPQKTI